MFYGIPQEKMQAFQQALNIISDIYPRQMFAADMLIALSRNTHFMQDPRFRQSYESTVRNDQERSLVWRLHVLAWAADHAKNIEGDFVECGVLRGFSSAVLCKFLEFEKIPKTYYLYDTFEGLSEDMASEKELRQSVSYKQSDSTEQLEEVRQLFASYPNVRIVKGVVPHSFTEAMPEKVAFMHLDMNAAKAEIAALENLFDRMSPGAVLVFDDFGWQAYRDQMIAEVEYMLKRGYSILELPTGQGLVLKR